MKKDKRDPSEIIDERIAQQEWEDKYYRNKSKKKYVYSPEEAKALNKLNM